MSGQLLTIREAADSLGRSQDFVRGLIHRGRLVSMRINGRYYVPAWSIEELLRPKAEPLAGFAKQIKPKRRPRASRSAEASARAGGGRSAA